MTLSVEECLAAISGHSDGLAEAARDNLAAPVEHCPGWTVADLVWHVADVHWFWRTIAGELLSEPPDESRRPSRPSDDELVDHFLAGADALVSTLREADQSAACWSWATQKDVAFVTRHQVQEAAVHHWDAANATRGHWTIDERVAMDCVEEFLTFSVSSDDDPADPVRPALGGTIWLCDCYDDEDGPPTWVITDGELSGTIAWHRDDANTEEYAGNVVGAHVHAASTLLWLYERIPDRELFEVDPDDPNQDFALVERFRALCFTD